MPAIPCLIQLEEKPTGFTCKYSTFRHVGPRGFSNRSVLLGCLRTGSSRLSRNCCLSLYEGVLPPNSFYQSQKSTLGGRNQTHLSNKAQLSDEVEAIRRLILKGRGKEICGYL